MTELIGCVANTDELIAARSIAILERMSRTRPEVAELAKTEILIAMDPTLNWLVRMNVCRLLPLVDWRESEYERILSFLFEEVGRNEGFVAAWALDALVRFAAQDESIRPRVMFLLDEALATGSPAVRARARKALKGLGR